MLERGHWALVSALRTVRFKDRQPFRQTMFAYLAGHQPLVRAVLGLHRVARGTPLSTLAIGAYGLLPCLTTTAGERTASIWAVGAYRNEKRQFDFVRDALGDADVLDVEVGTAGWKGLGGLYALTEFFISGDLGAYVRLVERVDREDGFLVACRMASTVGYFVRARDLLKSAGETVECVLVSSDSNPYAMGFVAAARASGRKVAYITHGHLPEDPPALNVDLALLDGPALERVYRRAGPLPGRVVYKGAEGDYRPLGLEGLKRRRPRIGIFMSILVDWESVGRLIHRLEHHLAPELILLRLHPNTTIRDPAAPRHIPRLPCLEVSGGEQILTGDAERCDVVFAGNSSCHLTILEYGVPTVYLRELDEVPHDFYGFIRDRIVPEFSRPEDVDLDEVAAFFADSGWAARFRDYDPTYPSDAEGASTRGILVRSAVRAAFRQLLAP